ncbi:MAG: midas domain-containing protein [Planctomycetota bacterium]
MPEDVSQDDIDKLLDEALGGPTSSIKDDLDEQDDSGADQSQAGIDALLSDAMGGDSGGAEEPPESSTSESDIDSLLEGSAGNEETTAGDESQGQSDIDALLSGGDAGEDEQPASETKEHTQEDIDALLGDSAEAEEVPAEEDTGGAQSQDDIDALLSGALGDEGDEAPAPDEAPADEIPAEDAAGGAQSQDDIDALLSGALGDEGDETSASDEAPADEIPAEEDAGGAQSQDDIDALLSGALGDEGDENPAEEVPAEEDAGGAQSQDDIDALLSGALGDEGDEASVEESPVEEDTGGAQSQDDIDSLLSGALGGEEDSLPADEDSGTAQGQDDIDSLLSGAIGDDEGSPGQDIPDGKSASAQTLIADSGILEGAELEATAEEDEEVTAAEEPAAAEEEIGTADDLADLLGDTASEETAEGVQGEEKTLPEPEQSVDDLLGDISDEEVSIDESELDKTTDLGMGDSLENILSDNSSDIMPDDSDEISSTVSQAFDEVSPALESALNAPAEDGEEKEDILGSSPPPADSVVGKLDNIDEKYKIDISSISESLSLLQSGSEIEGITGEIASLLGQLSERARKYQSAYQGGNQEITDLRSRLRAAEKRVSLLNSEKISLQEEMTVLRSRVASTEEEHVTYVEKSQSDISSLQVKVRERDNRLRQLESEIESLNTELKNSHTVAANSDVESRRAMFELERIRSDHEAEKQERVRLQRMLDTREQEIQAIQSRSAGEASSLFMDELHRLIRRLESELNVRTGAAREALSALDLLSGQSDNPQAVSVARKNLLVASGVDENSDALKYLGRMQDMPGGERKVSGTLESGDFAVNLDDFSKDLNALEMEEACLKAGRILSERSAPPHAVMDRMYNSAPLRTENAGKHLVAIIMLFKNIDQAQKSADTERGRETSDTEKVYVMMFDMLHYLVRIKAINKSTPEAWSFFLDVRGRYSFITSDAQWTAYKDKQLK